LTLGVFQDAPQTHVVEVAAQAECKTVGFGQERLYGPTPAYDATKEQHRPRSGAALGRIVAPSDLVGPRIEHPRALVRPEAIDPKHRSERDSEQTFDGVDIVFGTAHEKRVTAPLDEGGRQPGPTPTNGVMEERRGYAVVVP
jgi:hypothetical protein